MYKRSTDQELGIQHALSPPALPWMTTDPPRSFTSRGATSRVCASRIVLPTLWPVAIYHDPVPDDLNRKRELLLDGLIFHDAYRVTLHDGGLNDRSQILMRLRAAQPFSEGNV